MQQWWRKWWFPTLGRDKGENELIFGSGSDTQITTMMEDTGGSLLHGLHGGLANWNNQIKEKRSLAEKELVGDTTVGVVGVGNGGFSRWPELRDRRRKLA